MLDPQARANSVTTVRLEGTDPAELIGFADRELGVVLGIGIGDLGGQAFRIAHMGHVNAPMILGTLSVVEASLAALGIPHGKGGVQAAVDWIAQAAAGSKAGAEGLGAPRAAAPAMNAPGE